MSKLSHLCAEARDMKLARTRRVCWSVTSSKINIKAGASSRLFLYGGKYMELKEGLLPVVRAEKDCDVYCPICHKLLHVEAGQVIPRCCGKTMEVLG